jgi:lysophospholipase
MGGCIGLRALHDGLDVKAVAFSAPMWGLAMASWLKPIAWNLPAIARKVGRDKMLAPGQTLNTYVLREDFELNTLTRDREMWERLQHQAKEQPLLSLGGPSLGWLYEASREMQKLSEMPSPDYPCLTFIGTGEKIVDPDRIKERMAHWPGGHLEVLQGGEHEVLVEIPETRNRVFDMIAAHFDAHP